ncbi:uroporphyrinogen decarboxylase family protein [Mariniphaga anaerophila]|uniref:uroporphyrinogen decarboxylase family protein n=1 Tax=Mariniphaga anaerophila TaxID=1484053 RepID=UPI001114DF3A|nr:uroporphyrinogen decarboxylase family protein [Mariniphaga anaerophila]
MEQLVSYIAPSAPATRRPAVGDEPDVRLEIGFTPRWYRNKLGIDFGEKWHNNPEYRKQTVLAMRQELKKRFHNRDVGIQSEKPDLLTGLYGACTIAAIYEIPIIYSQNNWPTCASKYLSDSEVDSLNPPDLMDNYFFQKLLEQVKWIHEDQGEIIGFINWQGVLNNACRLRGEQIFVDMFINPERVMHLLDCVSTTMIEGVKTLYMHQKGENSEYKFVTISNCLVNMISPEQYRDFIMPFDLKISKVFGTVGIHNCAWNANPYMEYYSKFSNLGYIDMGIDSDLKKAKEFFSNARRALMYTPMDLYSKSTNEIEDDIKYIVNSFSPCDIIIADIDEDIPDSKVCHVIDYVEKINFRVK